GERERSRRDGELVVTDVDTERLLVERVRQTSCAEGVHALPGDYRKVTLAPIPAPSPHRLIREFERHPFVPADPATLDERCQEIFSIQTAGLAKRLEHTRLRRGTLGLSGGLDSPPDLPRAAQTVDLIALARLSILARICSPS